MNATATETCPCGKGEYSQCCGLLHEGAKPASPEQLMRARYSAYAKGNIEFLKTSLAPDQRHDFDEKAVETWSKQSEWLGIEIRQTKDGGPEDTVGLVEFVARYKHQGVIRDHREMSEFRKIEGHWYFQDGRAILPAPVRNENKVGRNDPCTCGSGKKYKKCCGV